MHSQGHATSDKSLGRPYQPAASYPTKQPAQGSSTRVQVYYHGAYDELSQRGPGYTNRNECVIALVHNAHAAKLRPAYNTRHTSLPIPNIVPSMCAVHRQSSQRYLICASAFLCLCVYVYFFDGI